MFNYSFQSGGQKKKNRPSTSQVHTGKHQVYWPLYGVGGFHQLAFDVFSLYLFPKIRNVYLNVLSFLS